MSGVDATRLRHDEPVRERSLVPGIDAAGALPVQRLAVVAHELRRPLLPIAIAAALLEKSAGDPQKLARLQRTIERQVELLSRVVADLTETTRTATGGLAIERRRIETTAFLHRAVDACRPALDARGQQLRVRMSRERFELHADAGRLTQVVTNLVENASKFSDEGTTIRVGLRVFGDAVVLRVADEGIGIEPAEMASMFELFAQGGRAKRFHGAGLGVGLWIVREIVRAHDGQVRAKSAGSGRGTRFVVALPCAARASEA